MLSFFCGFSFLFGLSMFFASILKWIHEETENTEIFNMRIYKFFWYFTFLRSNLSLFLLIASFVSMNLLSWFCLLWDRRCDEEFIRVLIFSNLEICRLLLSIAEIPFQSSNSSCLGLIKWKWKTKSRYLKLLILASSFVFSPFSFGFGSMMISIITALSFWNFQLWDWRRFF